MWFVPRIRVCVLFRRVRGTSWHLVLRVSLG
ncbi:hypothetical protein QO012_002398 [Methylobacterium aerolatum]|uniref:Uncharacterized protein n=1 Tax=Methylobacterium aerolatum TaxID=418708 RepID=A0ABU0HZW4_9HYPH|nr:hypothetical protein [Methylobacterium aerolatum]GJD34400.1 hypothetical protein FMGBMHLM_1299 [Methylobacterium aerolatum]